MIYRLFAIIIQRKLILWKIFLPFEVAIVQRERTQRSMASVPSLVQVQRKKPWKGKKDYEM